MIYYYSRYYSETYSAETLEEIIEQAKRFLKKRMFTFFRFEGVSNIQELGYTIKQRDSSLFIRFTIQYDYCNGKSHKETTSITLTKIS